MEIAAPDGLVEVDAPAIEARRRSGLEPAHSEAEAAD